MIIIAGVPRSGKSTVARHLKTHMNISHLPFDSLVSTLGRLYPDIGITHYEEARVVSRKVAPFISEFIRHMEYEEEMIIIDVYQLFPEDLIQYGLDTGHRVAYFGYPGIPAEQPSNFAL